MIVNNEVLSVISVFSYTYGVALSTQTDYYGKLLYFTAKPGQKKNYVFLMILKEKGKEFFGF